MIPDGELYNTGSISAGTVSDLETAVIDTEQVGQPVGYGQGVQISNGMVVPAFAELKKTPTTESLVPATLKLPSVSTAAFSFALTSTFTGT